MNDPLEPGRGSAPAHPSHDFVGQVAIVTGASSGIGAATARALAQSGARVALLARRRPELDALARRITNEHGEGRALAVPTDVSQEVEVEAAFAQVGARWGAPHVLVNNAGVLEPAPITELSLEAWERTLAVNLRGTFLCARAAFRSMKDAGRGAIVNVSSLGGVRGTVKFAGFSAYSASKAGVVAFTECLSVEGKPHGVRVNCVAPGAVDTDMLRRVVLPTQPGLRATAQPEDVAHVILFLADSRRAHLVTGAVVELNTND